MMNDEKKIKLSARIPNALYSAYSESGVFEIFTMTELINYALNHTYEYIQSKYGYGTSVNKKYCDAIKRKMERDISYAILNDNTSKIFSYGNFEKQFRKALSVSRNKEDIIIMLDNYIAVSETYNNNDVVTERLKRFRSNFEKMTIPEFKIIFETEIQELRFKFNGSLKKDLEGHKDD